MVTGPNDTGWDKIEALGVTFVIIPLEKNGMNPISDIKYLLKLKKLIKQEKPDVTFGYTIKPNIYGAIAAKMAKTGRIVSLVTGAGYLFAADTLKAKLARMLASVLYRIGFACADAVIFQNPDDQKEFVGSHLLKAEKTHVVNGSGVNMGLFTPEPLPKTLTFFMLARIMKSKGVFEYLSAAEQVKQAYPDTRFLLLGALEGIQDSVTGADLQRYIDKGIIEYFGETDDVRSFYQQASVFVLPSFREGTPRTVLEAMAMKRPIITTDVPGCRGTVKDGETGFLVPKQDVNALVEKMIWFIAHPQNIKPMGEAAYAYCTEKYEIEKVNQDMRNILLNH
jgi:glycosyltransferase involved in cell wall biosynthesis